MGRGLYSDNPSAPPYTNGPYSWSEIVTFESDLTCEGDFTVEGSLVFGDASVDTITVNGVASFLQIVNISDNKVLQFEGVAADLDGLSISCDNAGDATISSTAGTLVLNTSDNAISMTGEALTVGSVVVEGAANGISIAASTTALLINGVTGAGANSGIYLNPTTTANSSMTPIRIAYNYDGATNTGTDIDLFSIRSTITQTGTNAEAAGLRGFIQGMRSDVVTSGFTDVVYANYANVTCGGTTTSAEIYGMCSAVYLGTYEATVTHVAALFGKVNGSGNVVGSGAADVVGASGLYISWSSTNAMATCLTAGSHIAIEASSLCDSGYQVDAGGTLVNGLFVRNTAGTITNGIKIGGAVSIFADFTGVTGCAVATTGTPASTSCAQILVTTPAGATGYINVYSSSGS